MYTIIMDNDRNLNTTIRTNLLRHSTTDEIQFLWKPTSLIETISDDSEENPQVVVENVYTALLRYEVDNIMKTETLITDEDLYKERVRFVLPRSSAFFNNSGMIQIWLDITTETTITTTTTTIDPETGEETTETTVETETESFDTLPTTVFIKEVPRNKRCHRDDDNTIRITRGDSLTVNILLTDNDGFEYEPVEGDEVWFTVKKSAIAEDVLIRKSVDIDNLVLDLVESDTKDLAFGKYVYEIEVITTQNDHYTVIKNAPFIITEELH